MLIGGTRRDHKTGAAAVVFVQKSSPFIGGYRFDSSLDGGSEQPWVAKYSNPSTLPSVTNAADHSSDIAVAPSNDKVVMGGEGSTQLHIYDYTLKNGFGNVTTRLPRTPLVQIGPTFRLNFAPACSFMVTNT